MAFPYDLTIGGYNFMLTKSTGADGRPAKSLTVSEAPGPNNPQLQTNSYAEFDRRYDVPVSQTNFSGGLGQLEFDTGENNRYLWGSGVVTHCDGKVYVAPPTTTLSPTSMASAPAGFLSYVASSGTQYDFMWEGPRLHRRDASNGSNTWTLVYTAGENITDFVVFNDGGQICSPTDATAAEDFFYQADVTAAATWTPTARDHAAFSNADGKPKYMKAVRDTLYAAVDSQKIFYTTDATADGWIGPIDTKVSDTTYDFVGLTALSDYLFAFKYDAGYNIDSSQVVYEIFDEWKDKPSSVNFKYIAKGPGALYYSVANEVYEYDPTTGRNVPFGLAKQSSFSVLQIDGVGADNQYVYVLAKVRVRNVRSANSEALFRCVKQRGGFAFECIWEDTASTSYSRLFATAYGSATRVYWGKGTTQTMHMDVAAEFDETTTASFNTAGTLYTSITRGGEPGFQKRALWLGTTHENLTASVQDNISYSTDSAANFTSIGTVTSNGLVETDIAGVAGREFMLKFLFAGTATVTPILRAYDLHLRPRWRYLQQVVAVVRIADNIELLNGAPDTQTADTILSNLKALRALSSSIAYTDLLGNSFNVSIDSISYSVTRHEPTNTSNTENEWEATATIVMTEASWGS